MFIHTFCLYMGGVERVDGIHWSVETSILWRYYISESKIKIKIWLAISPLKEVFIASPI